MNNAGRRSAGRLVMLWVRIRDSLWFIPGLAAILAVFLATLLVQVPTPSPESRLSRLWLFGGGAEGARGVLSTIAGSLITVTGVVFSVTIVALQLASSQFSPRLLRSFVGDRANQVVLGIFIGTFTYTLLVLRTTRSTSADGEGFVPQVAVAVAMALLLLSIAALIFFIDHAARSMQASVILQRETMQTLDRLTHLFPEEIGRGEPEKEVGLDAPSGPGTMVLATETGYVQAVSGEALLELAAKRDLVVRLEVPVGRFVLKGGTLATVWPADQADDEIGRAVRRAVVLGPDRTPEQDPEFGIQEIADIAVRALSPGINDPTTAMMCIDRLTQILAARACRREPAQGRMDREGRLRLIASANPFSRSVELAFGQIRHYGVQNPGIARQLLQACLELARVAPSAHRAAIVGQVEAVLSGARLSIESQADLRDLERLGSEALSV